MSKQRRHSNFIQRITLRVVITSIFLGAAFGLSDKRLCADESCKDLISMGKGLINYPAGEEGMVSFKKNSNIRIKSKSAGSDLSLWGIEVNGREGYAPKHMIREEKIIIKEKDLKYVVDVLPPRSQRPLVSHTLKIQDDLIVTTTKPFGQANMPEYVENNSGAVEASVLSKPGEFKESFLPNETDSPQEEELGTTKKLEQHIAVHQIGVHVMNTSADVLTQAVPKSTTIIPSDNIDVDDTKDLDLSESLASHNAISQANNVPLTEVNNFNNNNVIEISDNEQEDTSDQTDTIRLIVDGENNVKTSFFSQTINKTDEETLKPNRDTEVMNNAVDGETVISVILNPVDVNQSDNATVNTQTSKEVKTVDRQLSIGATKSVDLENARIKLNTNSAEANQHYTPSLNNNQILNPTNSLETTEEEHVTNDSALLHGSNNQEIHATKKSEKDSQTSSPTTVYEENSEENIEKRQIEMVLNENPIQSDTDSNIENMKESDISTKHSLPFNNTAVNYGNNGKHEEAESTLNAVVQNVKSSNQQSKNIIDSANNGEIPLDKISTDFVSNELNNEEIDVVKRNGSEMENSDLHFPVEVSIDKQNQKDIEDQSQNSEQEQDKYLNDLRHNHYINEEISTTPLPSNHDSNIYDNSVQESTEKVSVETETKKNDDGISYKDSFLHHIPYDQDKTKKITDLYSVKEQGEQNQKNAYANNGEIPLDKISTDFVSNELNNEEIDVVKRNGSEMENSDLHFPVEVSIDKQNQKDIEDQSQNSEQEQDKYLNDLRHNHYINEEISTTPLPSNHDSNIYDNSVQESTEKVSVETETKKNDDGISYKDSFLHHIPYDQDKTKKITDLYSVKEQGEQNQKNDVKVPQFQAQSALQNDFDKKENKGLFATIMETVNNILPNSKKYKNVGYDKQDSFNELDRILFSGGESAQVIREVGDKLFCEKLDHNNCPSSENNNLGAEMCECSWKTLFTSEFTLDSFVQALASKILEISELIAFLCIVASTSLFFIFGYYCFCKSSNEGSFLSKLNLLESSLLASHKENAILKQNLISTRQKLASIEDNSFGSNEMVVSLKRELEDELLETASLKEQIVTLQKELENAADAGIELNKIVSELLSNQTGDESIISSVEELQKQLNEQQNTILEINASLAEKSRENSELQLMIAEQNSRYETQLSDLQQDNYELESEKENLKARLEVIRADFNRDITAALESKNFEIKRLQSEIVELNDKVEAEHAKWQTCTAKIEALEECLRSVKRDPKVNINQLIDVANIRAELLDNKKKYTNLKDRMEIEVDARKLVESQLQSATAEIDKIKQDFNQTEKDKLEAQTRLEVLSAYFKEKENQLQKELSLKETMWLKQQGETTTTVDRLTTMQEDIQSLRSQNDALRAEIEAQVAAHKAQIGTLENRAHETWLAARQSDRRYEEARAEATALRRKLTSLAGGIGNEINKSGAGGPASLGDDLANAPSPVHMEPTGSPILSRMPPPPFLPPPFMGPPPPFLSMPPPPPFVPPGEIRPAPLGRILSPPPQRSGQLDFDEYLDYEGASSWHRHHTYSPAPRTYRSLSPTDSRYNYGNERDLISTYDTETDFSPPPSPRGSRRRGGGSGSEKEDCNLRKPYHNSKKIILCNKDRISSGSDTSSIKEGKKVKSSGGKFLI